MNLLEIMIVVGIMMGLLVVAIPLTGYLLRLDQKQVASGLAIKYQRLHDEAQLRNLTFRIAYHIDDQYYEVEVGESAALLFTDPEKRAEHEAAVQEKLEHDQSRFASDDDGVQVNDDGLAIEDAKFTAIQDRFTKKVQLPDGTRFIGVYTPAYGEMIQPTGEDPEEMDPEDKRVVYSYILPSGISEHTLIQIGRTGDDDHGYTVEVEPMTGKVYVDAELRDYKDRFDFVPDEGPDLDM
ncbi:MAG: hypothetical protein ACI9MC_000246 [Kiritimatiellia bacterium]|jgi:hypothetical protein